MLEAVPRSVLEDLRGLGSSIEIAKHRCQSGSPGRDRGIGAHALLHHLDDLLCAALIDTRLLQRGRVDKDGVGLPGLLPDLQRALEQTLAGDQIAVHELPTRRAERGEPVQRGLVELVREQPHSLERKLGALEVPPLDAGVELDVVRRVSEGRITNLGGAANELLDKTDSPGERIRYSDRLG